MKTAKRKSKSTSLIFLIILFVTISLVSDYDDKVFEAALDFFSSQGSSFEISINKSYTSNDQLENASKLAESGLETGKN